MTYQLNAAFDRALTEAGATAFLLTSGWPTPRIEHWDVLTRARAIENQAYVLGVNRCGSSYCITHSSA